jgi:hypothetical protein
MGTNAQALLAVQERHEISMVDLTACGGYSPLWVGSIAYFHRIVCGSRLTGSPIDHAHRYLKYLEGSVPRKFIYSNCEIPLKFSVLVYEH